MLNASPSARVDLSVATATTRPVESKTGPPEFPGLSCNAQLKEVHAFNDRLRAHEAFGDGVLEHDLVAGTGVSDQRDVFSADKRVGRCDVERGQFTRDGEKGQIAFGIFVEQLHRHRTLLILGG